MIASSGPRAVQGVYVLLMMLTAMAADPGVPAPEEPAPAPATGELMVQLVDAPTVGSLEVTCRQPEFRQRASLVDGAATFTQVPIDGEACVLFFRGGPPARFEPVSGGQSLVCSLDNTTASCAPAGAQPAPDAP